MPVLSTVLEVLGLALIVLAAALVAIPLGIAVGGAAFVLVGYLLGRDA
jgi:hypothetical protein